MIRKTVAILAALAATTTGSWAMDQEQAEKALEFRQGLMHVILWNVMPMAGMAKERVPYDADKFQLHAERVAYAGTMIVEMFRPDTSDAVLETESLDEIWEDFETFEDLAVKSQEKSAALARIAASGDFAAVQAGFMEMGEGCKACHDKFREEH